MPRPYPRRRAAVHALISVLLVVLTAGAFCGTASAASGASAAATAHGRAAGGANADPAWAVDSAPADGVWVADGEQVVGGGRGLGCGEPDQHEGDVHPAAPPRGSAAYELLSTLAYAHGAASSDASPADSAHRAALSGRAPPPPEPPTPVTLSVLRV
ncbi:hypothetical protein ACX6XY_15195 [Streptomyces sp. O3]